MTRELDNCPFCGKAPLIQEIAPHKHGIKFGDFVMPDHDGSFVIECPTGNCCAMIATKREAAVAAWNRRATPSVANGAPAGELPPFVFEDNADFMRRLDLLLNTKYPEMRKDALARKISELANEYIHGYLRPQQLVDVLRHEELFDVYAAKLKERGYSSIEADSFGLMAVAKYAQAALATTPDTATTTQQPAGWLKRADLVKLGNCRAELWALPQSADAVPLFRAPPAAMLQEFLSIIHDRDLAVGDRLQRIASRITFYCKVPHLQEDPVDIIRTLLCAVDRVVASGSPNEPSPIASDSPLMLAARRACVERGFTAGGLAVDPAGSAT